MSRLLRRHPDCKYSWTPARSKLMYRLERFCEDWWAQGRRHRLTRSQRNRVRYPQLRACRDGGADHDGRSQSHCAGRGQRHRHDGRTARYWSRRNRSSTQRSAKNVRLPLAERRSAARQRVTTRRWQDGMPCRPRFRSQTLPGAQSPARRCLTIHGPGCKSQRLRVLPTDNW